MTAAETLLLQKDQFSFSSFVGTSAQNGEQRKHPDAFLIYEVLCLESFFVGKVLGGQLLRLL